MKDVAKVYFISPYDLIIDYHSLGSELPLSDNFIVITQYRFHCDINYDIKKGKFIFKTSGKIFNTLQFVKETLLKRTIRNESNTTNKEEITNPKTGNPSVIPFISVLLFISIFSLIIVHKSVNSKPL